MLLLSSKFFIYKKGTPISHRHASPKDSYTKKQLNKIIHIEIICLIYIIQFGVF